MEATADSFERRAALLAPLVEAPAESGVLSDVDGTLAPIAERPGDAAVPAVTRVTLAALAERYALVGCITGRRAAEAREMVGLDNLHYVGIHGFERLEPGDTEPILHPRLREVADDARSFLADFGIERCEAAGLRIEDKGPVQALHWRGADDEDAAKTAAEAVGAEARGAGLVPHLGRKVVELRPPVKITKGTALRRLVEENGIARCLYAGDDHTDLDAFAALGELTRRGTLRHAVRVGVAAPESPSDISEMADIVVSSPQELLPVLQQLAL